MSAAGQREDAARARVLDSIRTELDRGAPWEAIDAFREAIEAFPSDSELLYWGALAHARAGAGSEAHALLDQAQAANPAAPALRSDILSLRGRLAKDELHRASGDPRETMLRARDAYLAAYAIERDPYPGINAASLSALLGERERGERIAREIDAKLAGATGGWERVTLAEAALLLGDIERARRGYVEACAEFAGDAGRVATMRRQLRLLARVLPEASELLPLLRAPDVIAFTGHMVDAPARAEPRFPIALEPHVAGAIRERVRRWHRAILYASAACGADLLAIEAALDAGAEVNVVLPFNREEFVRTSVAPGGDAWLPRFEAALARATRVILATDEDYLGDDALFEHAAVLVEGLAALRAAQLETHPSLVAVLDPATDARTGGTREAVERWERSGGVVDVIDLGSIRARAGAAATAEEDRARAPRGGNAASPRDAHRSVKSMLFADVAGYSRVRDAHVPAFQRAFWAIAARELAACERAPLLANSWGDALFAVLDSAADAAALALRLREGMQHSDWDGARAPEGGAIRIALHAGPVFRGYDPVLGRDNYFGSAVTRAARIEPVTPPGLVYASEGFAATLAASASGYSLQYVGTVQLAKRYGESRLYRLEAG